MRALVPPALVPPENNVWPELVRKAASKLRLYAQKALSVEEHNMRWRSIRDDIARRRRPEENADDSALRGTVFELFCVLYLDHWSQDLFSASGAGPVREIHWRLGTGNESSFPSSDTVGYNRARGEAQDRGTDAVLKHVEDGHMTLVQFKFRQNRNAQAGFGTFLADVNSARCQFGQDKRHALWMATDARHGHFSEEGNAIYAVQDEEFTEKLCGDDGEAFFERNHSLVYRLS